MHAAAEASYDRTARGLLLSSSLMIASRDSESQNCFQGVCVSANKPK